MENIIQKDNKPSNIGILLEYVRQNGWCNMSIEFPTALHYAFIVGRYLNIFSCNYVQKFYSKKYDYGQVCLQYKQAYTQKEYINYINNIVRSLPYGDDYIKAVNKYDKIFWNKNYNINDHLLEKAKNHYYNIGLYMRDIVEIKCAQTCDRYTLECIGMQMDEPNKFIKN